MEPGRMPLPAARNALPDVGASRRQGSSGYPCADAQVYRLLWSGQPAHGQICSFSVHQVRCQNLRGFSEETAAASLTEQKDGDRFG